MVPSSVAVIGFLITIIALLVSINQFKKQLQLTFFADYTKRYQGIFLNFPETINRKDFDFNALKPDKKAKTLKYMRAYFDLCSEELFLYNKGRIDDETWKEWKSGIEYSFSKTAFKLAWEIISLDTSYYSDFVKFVKPFASSKIGSK